MKTSPLAAAPDVAIYRSATLVQARTYDTPDGTPQECTGAAIAPEWILTAAHCAEGPYSDPDVSPNVLKVHFSNNKSNPGPSIDVDRFGKAPKADIGLLHLEAPKKLKKYPTIADDHQNRDGEDWLHVARMEIVVQRDNINAVKTIAMHGITGGSNHGYSGGPVFTQKR